MRVHRDKRWVRRGNAERIGVDRAFAAVASPFAAFALHSAVASLHFAALALRLAVPDEKDRGADSAEIRIARITTTAALERRRCSPRRLRASATGPRPSGRGPI